MRAPTYDDLRVGTSTPTAGGYQAPSGPSAAMLAGQQLQDIGQAATRTAGVAAGIATAMQDEANQIRVVDAMNQAVAARLSLTHDKQAGYLQLRGRDALDRPDGKSLDAEFGDRLNEQVGRIRDGLGNAAQKQAFTFQAEQLVGQFRGQVAQHMTQEFRAFNQSTQAGTVRVAADMMALNPYSPEALAQGQSAIKAASAELGRLQGLSPEETAAKTVEALTPAHAAVISTALQEGKTDYARAYLDSVSAELTPEARLKLGQSLKIGDAQAKAQAFGDEVMAKGMTLQDALAEARKRFEGDAEVHAVREVKERFSETEAVKARDAKDIGKAAWTSVMESGRIAPTLLADLRAKAPEEERQIRDWLEAKRRRAEADAKEKAATDMNVYYGLRRMAMDEPQRFGELDLRRSQPYLTDGDLKHLIEIQGGIAKGDAKAMESQRVTRQTLDAIKADVRAIGIDLTPKEGSPAAKETALFMGALTQALDEATKGKGAPLTAEEAKRIGMGMVREGVEQGSGIFGVFQTRKRGYQIATDPDIKPGTSFVNARFGDIPPAARDALAAELRQKRGIGTRALTAQEEAEIERAYTRGIQTGKFK
jgi:hypothetical protein